MRPHDPLPVPRQEATPSVVTRSEPEGMRS